MADIIISKIIGSDEDSGLQRRIDITGVNINIKAKVIDITYETNLVGKTGKIVKTEAENCYTRKNIAAVMGIRQVEGEPQGVTEQYEVSPAKNKFDELADSQVGALIKGMLENDLKNYPNL